MGTKVKAVSQLTCCVICIALTILVESIAIIIQLVVGVHIDAEVLWNIGSLPDVVELILVLISVSISVQDWCICYPPYWVDPTVGAHDLSSCIPS